MEKILTDIRAVPGVTGALVVAKRSRVCYHLLPPGFTAGSTQEVTTRLLKLSEKMPPSSRLDLKFDNGIGLVYNLERSVVLIFGGANLDTSLLGLVLKSALQSIERKLEELIPEVDQVPQVSTITVDKESLSLLIEAINLVAKGYVKEQGTYRVTRNLRKTKEDVIVEFPQVSSFYVDNDGRVSVMKAKEDALDSKIPIALIKWIDLFVRKTSPPSRRDRAADVRKLTAHISKPLEGMGFYDLYNKVTKKLL
ncbi:MAG: hypothetical protein WCE90_03430 [Candidatus Zixiibacteriota bacterium]